jgi:hypothetical protein
MENNRNHHCQEDGAEKGPGDDVTEVECNGGQSQQEKRGRGLFSFHWHPSRL